MPGNEDLNIVLKLIDQASAQLKGALGDAGKEADKVNKQSDKAAKSLKDNFKEAGKQLRDFKRAAFAVTITIGTIMVMTKEWAKHNRETKTAYDELGLGIKNIVGLIGSLFAPAIVALASLINNSLQSIKNLFSIIQDAYTGLFKAITYGIQYSISFFAAMKQGVGIMEAHKIATNEAKYATEELAKQFQTAFVENVPQTEAAKIALEDYKKVQQDLEFLFKSGQITAQEYFNGIIQGQNQVIEQNEIIAEQARAYIELANEVANTELLNFQARLQGQMDLFTTYKEMYMQGHADMFAFANILSNEFYSNMSTALSNIILGTAQAKDAFKAFGAAMVKAIVDYMVQQAVAYAVSKVMQAIITTTTSAMAVALANAWAPAAALASLATVGANAPAAIAGINATVATAYALATPKGMAQGGEGIVTKPTLFLAGEAGAERYSFTPLGRGGSAGPQIVIYLNATISGKLDIVDVAEQLGFEIERQLTYARGV